MSKQYSIYGYAEQLKKLSEAAKQKASEVIIVPAANKLLAKKKNTIQVEGENTAGGKIGDYSTKAAYYSREQFVKKSAFKPQGKKGRRPESKTMYLPQGYKQLRDIQGRPTDKINETYTGDTMAAYQLQVVRNGAVIGFVNERASRIRKGQESRFGKIFYAQKEELEAYNKEVANAAQLFTSKILNGSV